jgi:hypothetical protein
MTDFSPFEGGLIDRWVPFAPTLRAGSSVFGSTEELRVNMKSSDESYYPRWTLLAIYGDPWLDDISTPPHVRAIKNVTPNETLRFLFCCMRCMLGSVLAFIKSRKVI